MDYPLIEITKEELIKDFCEITRSEKNKFLEDAVETLLHSPTLFLKTRYHTEPKGYTAFDMKDPYLSYLNILSVIYITNVVQKAVQFEHADFTDIARRLNVNALRKPGNKEETIATIVDIYDQLRGLERLESRTTLTRLVEKFLETKV